MQKALISSRNKYNIPPVGLTFDPTAPNGPTEIYQEFTFGTSLELDLHHHHLLQSDNEQEVLLGIYSTIYWSQYAFLSAEERPRTIDDFLALLPPAISVIKPAVAAAAMKNAIMDLSHKHHAGTDRSKQATPQQLIDSVNHTGFFGSREHRRFRRQADHTTHLWRMEPFFGRRNLHGLSSPTN